jgi:hypothetical protein
MRFFKRKKFIVNTTMQYRLICFSLAYVGVFSLTVGLGVFLPLMMDIHTSEAFSPQVLRAASLWLFLHDNLWPIVSLSILAIGLHSIYISYKIAGPLYRFSLMLTAIKEGRLPKPASLRKGDYLLHEMAVVNETLTSLRDRVSDMQQAQRLLHQDIAVLQDIAMRGTLDELIEQITSLAEKDAQLGEKLGAIHIEA